MSSITLKNIYKKYEGNQKYAVTDFNLEIEDSEFIVFVGPSGCGKSTTLRMIAGLEDITDGTILIDNKVINDIEPKDRDIAMVFQNYALYPHMTVYDNMAFGLKLRKMPKNEIDKLVHDAADILGIRDYLKRKPSALSGGERQRVALGRSIVRNAKVFLMDEPLSNLDAKLRVAMRAEILKLHQRLKTTTIYVTHDQTEAMTMASRIVIMKDGYIQQIGTPKDVYNNPDNIFVAGFIGTPPMNFFNVKFSGEKIFNEAGFDLTLDKDSIELLRDKGYNNKEIVFGIRSEDIHVLSDSQQKESTLNSKIVVSELLGSEVNLYLNVGQDEFVSKASAENNYVVGDTVKLWFNTKKGHFFDKDSSVVIR